MAEDPICGMAVDEKAAEFKSQYSDKTYCFCSQMCKATFDKNPAKYAGRSEHSDHSVHSGHMLLLINWRDDAFMNEHEHERETRGTEYSRNHLLIIALCCLIPIVLVIAVVSANIENTYLPFILILSCPLLMLLMHLPHMLSPKKKESERKPATELTPKIAMRKRV